jgi:lysyl-tRNA synthetase class 1
MLLFYQLYHDWDEVGRRLQDEEGVKYMRPYIEEWIAREFIPDEYRFKYQPNEPTENVKKFMAGLTADMDALAVHNAVFDFAKANLVEPKQMFTELYEALLGKERGPRMGKLVAALGVERIKKDLGM